MSVVYRRVILKPDGLSERDGAKLADLLRAAVERQKQLASKSPHILQFVSDLEENDRAFFVEHEPATTCSCCNLFDAEKPDLDTKDLLRITGALFEALRVAHAPDAGRPVVHGGLCPAVLVKTPDGIDKVSDFGIAPAVCVALSPEYYLNLAVRTPESESDEIEGTAVWEVLSPDEYERDDRICSFVDPEKYGSQLIQSFETGSDIIAAAFVLHLIAEHQHPYLFNETDAHRMVEMSEFMAMGRYNGMRRKDLRQSDDPAIRFWCDSLEKMLGRLPQNRPSAAELAESISEFVKPPDAGELLARSLSAIAEHIEKTPASEIDWPDVKNQVTPIAANEAATEELATSANAIIKRANAHIQIEQADQLLKSEDWADAQPLLKEALGVESLPADVTEHALALQKNVEALLGVRDDIANIRSKLSDDLGPDAAVVVETLQSLQQQTGKLLDDALPSALAADKEALVAELDGRLADAIAANEQLRAALQADTEQAEQFRDQLQAALDAQQWDALQEAIDAPPAIKHWPTEVGSQIDAIKQEVAAHRAEQERLAAIAADTHAANEWIDLARTAAEVEEWDEAERILADKPELAHWPDEVVHEAERIASAAATARQRQADFEKARQWCAELEKAIANDEWHVAFEKHQQRPDLAHWPEEVLEKDSQFGRELEAKREEIERDRRITEEQHALATKWLAKVKKAAEKEKWEAAVDVLDTRPDISRWPEGVLEQAQAIEDTCRSKLGAQLLEQLQERTQAVKTLAESFVAKIVDSEFKSFVAPAVVKTTVQAEEFTSTESAANGQAELCVRLADPAGRIDNNEFALPFSFQLKPKKHRICDDDGALRDSLTTRFTKSICRLQQTRISDLIDPLTAGLFPKAKLDVDIPELVDRATAHFNLSGGKQSDATIQADITWSPSDLEWKIANREQFAASAWEQATAGALDAISAKLVKDSKHLQRYKSAIGVSIASPSPGEASPLSKPLTLNVELKLNPGENSNPRSFHRFSVQCLQAGKVSLDFDIKPIEDDLLKTVAAEQNGWRDTLVKDLLDRIAAKSPKVKLTTEPSEWNQPIDKLQLKLFAKGHVPLLLAGTWNHEQFEFSLGKGADGSIDEYLALPIKGGPPKAAIAVVAFLVVAGAVFGISQMSKTPEGKHATLPPKNRPTIPTPGTNPNPGSVPTETGSVGNTNRNQNTAPTTTPITTPSQSYTGAIATTVNALSESTYLKPIAKNLVTLNGDTASPSLSVRVPGFADVLKITLIEQSNPKEWVLAPAGRDQLQERVRQLDALLQLVSSPNAQVSDLVKTLAATDGIGTDLLNASQVASTTVVHDWKLTPDNAAWAGTADVSVTFGTKNPQSIDLPAVNAELRDGTITLAASKDAADALRQPLVGIQRAALSDLIDDASTALPSFQLPPATEINTPMSNFTYEIPASKQLKGRTVSVKWDPAELRFDVDAWRSRINSIAHANEVITLLNKAVVDKDAGWLNEGTNGAIQELTPPENGSNTLHLGIPAAWDSKRVLPIDVVTREPGESALQSAERILTAPAAPAYWPFVHTYHQYKTATPTERVRLMTATADAATKKNIETLLDQKNRLADPVFNIKFTVLAGNLTQTPTLEMTFDSWWKLNPNYQLPQDINAEKLNATIEGLIINESREGKLKFIEDGGAAIPKLEHIPPAVKELSNTKKIAKLDALQKVVRGWGQRGNLEQKFDAVLGNDQHVTMKPAEAMQALATIWSIKAGQPIDAATPTDLNSFSGDLRKKLRNTKYWHGDDSDRNRPVPATVFIEYFSGTTNTYAIAWSASFQTRSQALQIVEGPELLRVCTNNDSVSATSLLEPVFQQVDKGIRATRRFQNRLGIVLAPDDFAPSSQMFNSDATQTEITSDLYGWETRSSTTYTWKSLHDLAFDGQFEMDKTVAGYRFQESLNAPPKLWNQAREQFNETDGWAFGRVLAATK